MKVKLHNLISGNVFKPAKEIKHLAQIGDELTDIPDYSGTCTILRMCTSSRSSCDTLLSDKSIIYGIIVKTINKYGKVGLGYVTVRGFKQITSEQYSDVGVLSDKLYWTIESNTDSESIWYDSKISYMCLDWLTAYLIVNLGKFKVYGYTNEKDMTNMRVYIIERYFENESDNDDVYPSEYFVLRSVDEVNLFFKDYISMCRNIYDLESIREIKDTRDDMCSRMINF